MKDRPKKYAFFDLDFTLLPCDSLTLFCNFILKKERWRIFYLIFFLPVVVLAAFRLIGSGTLKRCFLSFLWKMKSESLDMYAKEFVRSKIDPAIFPEMRDELQRQKKSGFTIILNTASPSFYVKYIAELLGCDAFYATNIQVDPVMPLFPRLVGKNNKNIQKIVSMLDILPESTVKEFQSANPLKTGSYFPERIPDSAAYSDSAADLPMLRLAEKVTVVHPSSRLKNIAEKSGWTTVHPRQPYHGNMGKYFMYLKQVLGLAALNLAIIFCASAISCTNYSSKPQTANPPIILSIAQEGTGHILTVSAQNAEIGFSGYELFQGISESAVRNAAKNSGVLCGSLAFNPNQAVNSIIEVKPGQTTASPTVSGATNRLCAVPLLLTAGTFVALRSLITQNVAGGIGESISSNAVVVP